MTSLKSVLIEKFGHDNGFEHVLPESSGAVNLGSARHPAKVSVASIPEGYAVTLIQGPPTLLPEMMRSFNSWPRIGDAFLVGGDSALAQCLRRTAALAQSLPNQAAVDFDLEVRQALAALPVADIQSTEVQRLVRQRVGQDRYRQAMMSYWGGACAVTGLALAPALRASHAKPWAECSSDAERLDVFNGFLLNANLDALFDKFLISFTNEGGLLVSKQLSMSERRLLGLHTSLCLRWVAPRHAIYLDFHRERFGNL